MLLTRNMIISLTMGLATSSPMLPTRSLGRRAAPKIAAGFTVQQNEQILNGISNALELASYAVHSLAEDVDSILVHYFHRSDRHKVIEVMNRILGPTGKGGAGMLGDITITPDHPTSNDTLTCTDQTVMAAMRDWDTDNPKIILCPKAGFGHGGIGTGFPGAPAVGCSNFGSRVSWKMETLGSILLGQYTHWKKLMVPPLSKETDDLEYGPYGTRFNLNKSKAIDNADSYSWFATENLWTIICNKEYLPPRKIDGHDPNCDNKVCTASDARGP